MTHFRRKVGTSSRVDQVWVQNGGFSIYLFGNFNTGVANTTGTVTRAFIATVASNFLGLEITGLSHTFNSHIPSRVQSNSHQFVADLLAGNDTLTGTSSGDSMMGHGGNDVLIGGATGDRLDGGAGSDTASYATASAGLFAGLEDANANTGDAGGDGYYSIENLIGSAFNDILYGDGAANILVGGAGNDGLVGKGGADRFDGGLGSDTVFYDSSPGLQADLLTPVRNSGDAKGDVFVAIENMEGSSFNDLLYGDNNANILRGNHFPTLLSGQDQLFGRGGNDQLLGFGDNDRLDGGAGRDLMAGGLGADVFDFNAAAEIGNSVALRDRIVDFDTSDVIDLSTIDANGAAAGNTAFIFLATMNAAFTGAKGALRWRQENPAGSVNDKTIVEGDIDGNKVADFQIELTGLKALNAADFVL